MQEDFFAKAWLHGFCARQKAGRLYLDSRLADSPNPVQESRLLPLSRSLAMPRTNIAGVTIDMSRKRINCQSDSRRSCRSDLACQPEKFVAGSIEVRGKQVADDFRI
jgi:hypothetical protein